MLWTHAKRQNTHYAATRGTDEYNRPLWLSVYHLCVCPSVCIKPCVCCCLMTSALTGSVYLSFCLPLLVWQPVCLWTSVDLSPCRPLAVPSTPSRGPLSCLPKCPPAPSPPWCMWTSEDLLWSKGLLNQSTLLNPPRSKTNWERLYQRSQFSMKRVLLCIN